MCGHNVAGEQTSKTAQANNATILSLIIEKLIKYVKTKVVMGVQSSK
jgi:hypothetical protein